MVKHARRSRLVQHSKPVSPPPPPTQPEDSNRSEENAATMDIDEPTAEEEPSTSNATKQRRSLRSASSKKKVQSDEEKEDEEIKPAASQNELRRSWSLEEIKIVYEAMKLTGGVDDVSQLTEVLPGKTAEEIATYVDFCKRTCMEHWNRVKSMFDCDKPTTPLEFWLSTMDDLTGQDGRWMRRAFSLAMGILGKYEEPSFPVTDETGEIPADVPNYGAIYNWLATLMLGYPEQPKALRPIDALIVLDLLDQLQQSANLRVSKNVPPLELLQRKHKLLKAPIWKADSKHSKTKNQITERRIGMALAREDQCDLMRFTENQMKSLMRNPPVQFEEGSGHNLPPALKPGEKWVAVKPKKRQKPRKADAEGAGSSNPDNGAEEQDDEWIDISSSEEEQAPQDDSQQKKNVKQPPILYAHNAADPLIIKKPFAQRLQSLNPFRLSKKYSRLELWSIPDGEDEAGTSDGLL